MFLYFYEKLKTQSSFKIIKEDKYSEILHNNYALLLVKLVFNVDIENTKSLNVHLLLTIVLILLKYILFC